MFTRTTLTGDAGSAAPARRFVADVLLNRDFSHAGIEQAALLISEAVTSAILYSQSDIELVVDADSSMARVELHVGRPEHSVLQDLELDATAGLRRKIMDALSEAWGVKRNEDGKCVWFELRR